MPHYALYSRQLKISAFLKNWCHVYLHHLDMSRFTLAGFLSMAAMCKAVNPSEFWISTWQMPFR